MAGASKLITPIIAWILGAVFLYAGILKLMHPDALLADIQSYDLVSYRIAYLGAYGLPALEIVAATGLFLRHYRSESAWIITALTAVFIVALSSAWMRGLDISCGCFGKTDVNANYPLLIGRDVLILFGLCVLLYFHKKSPEA